MRRAEDHDRPHLVDRVRWPVFALASLLLVLTLVDGVITLELLDHGCEEANPLMRFLLERSTGAFLAGKYVLTAIFLPVALVMSQYRLFGTRVRVVHFLPVVAGLYLVLIAYQVGLLNHKARRPQGPRPVAAAGPGARAGGARDAAAPGSEP
jgi:hypothetical protein